MAPRKRQQSRGTSKTTASRGSSRYSRARSSSSAFETSHLQTAPHIRMGNTARIARSTFTPARSATPYTTSRLSSSQVGRYTPSQASHRGHHYQENAQLPENDPELVESEADIERRENADALHEVIMAVDMKQQGTVGCSFYNAREEKLSMIEDIKLAGVEIVDTLTLYICPTIIIISTRADEALENHLSRGARSQENVAHIENLSGAYALLSKPSSDFAISAARERLLGLHALKDRGQHTLFRTPEDDNLVHEDNDLEERCPRIVGGMGGMIRLEALVNMESHVSVGCVGAVLSYLQSRRSIEYLPGDANATVAFRVNDIDTFTIADTMFVNADTLSALQIIHAEHHPNSHMQGATKKDSGAKESLSVYGLFHHLAHTPQGRHTLKRMFLRPSLDIEVIEERHRTITAFLRPDNAQLLQHLCKSLKKVKNIRTIVVHLQKGIATSDKKINGGIWASLRAFTYHALQISQAIHELAYSNDLAIVTKLLETLRVPILEAIGRDITGIIDFELSAAQHRAAVLQGVNPVLDNMKRTYDGMGSMLDEVATKLASEVPEWARNYIENCIFFPQLGFLTVVSLDPATGKGMYEGEGLDDIWQRMFSSEEVAYYKNDKMKQMDDYFGDLHGDICDKEIEIIYELAVRILAHEKLLVAASDACGDLDCLLALAQGSLEHNFVLPRMTTANVIHIESGRHPLQQLTVPSYVPNDTYLSGGNGSELDRQASPDSQTITEDLEHQQGPSLLLMTGPNYSGKSVHLKHIALIVYLAHIGCYVPAEKAVIGLTDKILTRIATQESMSKNQSAFMIDLQQIATAVRMATRRSLIVIDEFGKGTSASDGAGLACGVLEHFLSLGEERPKVLAATHFHEIFENGYLQERPEIMLGSMEISTDDSQEAVEDQVTYLYNFVPRRDASSFGTFCAAMNGIDATIVARADELMLMSFRGEDLVAACATVAKSEARSLEDAELIARQLLAADLPASVGGNIEKGLVRKMLDQILNIETVPRMM